MNTLASERQQAREHLARGVRHMLTPPVSDRARRMVEGIVKMAELNRSYAAQGGSGMFSYTHTMQGQARRLRERRKALARYVVANGGSARTAYAWARLLCSPFAFVTQVTQIYALRYIGSVERRARGKAAA